MSMFRRLFFPACLALVLSVLAGCAKKNTEDAMMKRVLSVPPVTEVPEVLPSALVDQNGYRTGSDKIVVFCGPRTDDTFEVRDTKDDAVVYTGSIRKGGAGTWFGQFGSFQTTGSYYIHTATAGSSYAFAIDDDVCARLNEDALRCLRLLREQAQTPETAGGDQYGADLVTAGSVLCHLLLAYEINPDAYVDGGADPYGKNDIPDLLDEAKAQAEVLITATGASREELLAQSCALAHFACVYAPFDDVLSDACLTAAKNAWDNAAASGTLSGRTDAFPAASALYRMTGEKTYENVLSAQFRQEGFTKRLSEDEEVFYGSVLYLFSRQPVNVAVRNTISETLAGDAKAIAKQAEEAAWFVSSGDIGEILSDMKRLAVANHFTYNHSYGGILENHLHYLSGRNPKAVNYLGTETERTYADSGEAGFPENAQMLAELLLLLGAS